jgi:myo-inositol-1(or 4)-monophosphatase
MESSDTTDKQAAAGEANPAETTIELPEGALATLKEAARRAGDIQLRYLGKVKNIVYKGAIDLVTEADRESEALIVSLIREDYPGHSILAEESGAHEGVEGKDGAGGEWRWVVDPLDGTTNYSHGLPIFAVSIALQRGETTAAACVYAPALDECYIAVLDGGASLNGDPIRVSATDMLQKSLLVTGFPYDRVERVDHYMEVFGALLKGSQGVLRWGSASIDLCHVACGRLEAFWEENLHPWDTAAGELIVREAGGRVTRFDGAPYSIFARDMLASNGRIHEQMTGILAPYRLDPRRGGPENQT